MTLLLGFCFGQKNILSADSISASKQKIQSLRSQDEELKKIINETKDKIDKQEEYKKTIENQINVVQQEIDAIDEKIQLLDNDINQKMNEISSSVQDIKSNIEKIKKAVNFFYTVGETRTIELILQTKTFDELVDVIGFNDIVQAFKDSIVSLREKIDRVKAQKTEIEQKRLEVANSKQEIDFKRSELSDLMAESQKAIDNLNSSKNEANAQLEINSAEISRMDQEINAYYAQQAAQSSSAKSVTTSFSPTTSFNAASGGYVWPTPGYSLITSQYGENRCSYFHSGIDIGDGGINGATIVAAQSGVVMRARWYGGYGNCVIIDHGNGKSTLYGHLSSILASEGQTVQQGQMIGKVGTTGDSTGPHLHFETRSGGTRYNPMSEY